MDSTNQRNESRIPVQIFVDEYVGDGEKRRCISMNLSADGIYLSRLLQPVSRTSPTINLEFQLPGTDETIWAQGKVRFDRMQRHFHGTGIEFTNLAVEHKRLITEYVDRCQKLELHRMLQQ